MAMCDARCRRCRARIGWTGRPIDQPPCPKCGLPPDGTAILKDQRVFDDTLKRVNVSSPETESGRTEAVCLQDWPPEALIYVGRKSRAFPGSDGLFGNPFSHKPNAAAPVLVETVERAVDLYRRWLEGDPGAVMFVPAHYADRRAKILAALPTLRGRRLGCWCRKGPCHAGVLADLADGPLGGPKGGTS